MSSVRSRVKLSVSVSSTSAEEKDLGNLVSEQYSDFSADGGSWKTLVPGNAVNTQLRLGNLANVAMLGVRTRSKDPTLAPSQINIRKNSSGGEEWPVLPFQDGSGLGREGLFIVTTTGITSLFASNLSSTDMEVIVTACGSS